jgi:uroporphyrinogen decarboxylase
MEINNRFLRACRREPVDATPVWFMRQAGRYMAEYRAIREKYSLLEICYHPELAAEVTLQPVRALGVDAAILFADILLPAIPLGVGLEFAKGEGPVLQNPVRTMDDVKNLRPVNPESDLGYVMEAIRLLRGTLRPGSAQALSGVPLIGFCGAPFTVASYLIEGGSSREFLKTKSMMYSTPEVFHALMEKLSIVLSDYLVAQIHAGAQAVQVFDSWVGALNPQEYENFVLPYSQKILQAVKKENTPAIHFGTNTATLLPLMKQAGGDVIGLDWRIPLNDGWKILGDDVAVQGNLDPALLFAPLPELKTRVHDILKRANGKPGHIFNLGHGILQNTPVENVKAVVDMVHEFSAEKVGA